VLVTLVLIGLVGGVLTGISPCILPVLPVVFLGGASRGIGARVDADAVPSRARPVLIVVGLTISFSIFTLVGTALLSLLHLPADLIRWAGLVVLVLLGVSMIVPAIGHLVEKPFAWIPQRYVDPNRGGLLLGLALGAVFVPCAGPVLAAITVAGATGDLGPDTIILTLAFAVGCAIPLLVFALAGRQLVARIATFRRHRRAVQIVSGTVMIALAIGLTFNVTDLIQRTIPNYTEALAGAAGRDASQILSGGANRDDYDDKLLYCQLQANYDVIDGDDCGPAPEFTGIERWLNTPGDEPLSLAGLRGQVVLVDFWAYSCINCQRELPHVEAWANAYASAGLTVVGVHTPEYAFEHVIDNVRAGADRIGVTFPIAIDNDYGTWNAYGNTVWPATYLIDATGRVRYVLYGEGSYTHEEKLIRDLLTEADPDVVLPASVQLPNTTPTDPKQSRETYLGAERMQFYAGDGDYTEGSHNFADARALPAGGFELSGSWTIGHESLLAGADAGIRLDYHASKVYLNVGGTGTITVTADGRERTIRVSGAPNIYTVASAPDPEHGEVELELSPGLEAYSFTFG
jgi:cytochrome c biogenesis protein CcdA/thiol-disulfide isomerase/thioredoxin